MHNQYYPNFHNYLFEMTLHKNIVTKLFYQKALKFLYSTISFLASLVSLPIWEAGKTIDLYWPTQLEQGGAKIDDCTACFTQIADYFKDYIDGKYYYIKK